MEALTPQGREGESRSIARLRRVGAVALGMQEGGGGGGEGGGGEEEEGLRAAPAAARSLVEAA